MSKGKKRGDLENICLAQVIKMYNPTLNKPARKRIMVHLLSLSMTRKWIYEFA